MFIIGDNFDLSHQTLNQGFRGVLSVILMSSR